MKTIYLIRHGETDYNKNGYIQGCGINSELNQTGKQQAEAFYNRYSHINFDKVYTSALTRTMQTVDAFIKQGVPHKELPGLNEISWGTLEGRRSDPEMRNQYFQMLREWKRGNTSYKVEKGESPDDVAQRQRVALQHIFAAQHERQVLVCMHGRAMRILLCQLMKKPLYEMEDFEHHNLGLYILEVNAHRQPSLLLQNCILHLKSA